MSRLLATTSLLALMCSTAVQAAPALMLGGTIRFGGEAAPDLGLSARVVSTNESGQLSLGLGVTYYPGSAIFGVDGLAGYSFDGGLIGVGYDFHNADFIGSLGFVVPGADDPPPPPPPPP